jgi:hypothetical protein
MNFKTISIAISIIALTACSKEDVSFNTLETARQQARENAEFNAQVFRSSMPNGGELKIVSRGDSTQEPGCPQGDGWATIDVLSAGGAKVAKLKCSTVSNAVGCRTDADFKESPYAAEDGKCAPLSKVPHPLPKIAK